MGTFRETCGRHIPPQSMIPGTGTIARLPSTATPEPVPRAPARNPPAEFRPKYQQSHANVLRFARLSPQDKLAVAAGSPSCSCLALAHLRSVVRHPRSCLALAHFVAHWLWPFALALPHPQTSLPGNTSRNRVGRDWPQPACRLQSPSVAPSFARGFPVSPGGYATTCQRVGLAFRAVSASPFETPLNTARTPPVTNSSLT